ncbi:uncharacterized protein LOC112687167 [Sipha flava]|uniref:Uncharacterized protein LOC112687167 n=1 Tax=Sipha flava TaxID=143950 RepID=A0A8B8FXI5_9HEMI|nr:uncharacterized protein LOC112687167 [Sipha flava]
MTFYRPVWMCGYLLGVFPYTVEAASSSSKRFRLHWFGVTMKTVHVLLFWSSAGSVGKMFYRELDGHHQRLKNKLFTTSPLNVDELYMYMALVSLATTAANQLQMALPSVATLAGECFLQPDHCGAYAGHRGYWLSTSAYVGVALIVYEFSMYFVLVVVRYNDQYFICLFSLLSNIVCIMVEQYFYIMCLALYLRLQHLHEDITNLVHKAEYPRWKCWVSPTVGGPTCLGIPAFSMSDIRNLRNIHLKAMELFWHINYSFQLPLLLNLLDSGFRIVVYTSELAYYLTNAIWNKNITTNYGKTLLYSGYCLIRIIRLWYIHSCEHYITKKIIPIRISLSWLTLALNPVTSRRLMPEEMMAIPKNLSKLCHCLENVIID